MTRFHVTINFRKATAAGWSPSSWAGIIEATSHDAACAIGEYKVRTANPDCKIDGGSAEVVP